MDLIRYVFGYLEFDSPVTIPDRKAGAVLTSNLHVWVEIDDLIVEPVTECVEAPGFPYISSILPKSYNVPPKSKFYYEEWMNHQIVGVASRLEEFLERANEPIN